MALVQRLPFHFRVTIDDMSDLQVVMLDVKITRNKCKGSFNPHRKPTGHDKYLSPESYHPDNIHFNWPL